MLGKVPFYGTVLAPADASSGDHGLLFSSRGNTNNDADGDDNVVGVLSLVGSPSCH